MLTGPLPPLKSMTFSDNKYARVMADFPDIMMLQFHSVMPKDGVTHHIPTTRPPLHSHTCILPPDNLRQAKEELWNMEEMKIVHHSDSPW